MYTASGNRIARFLRLQRILHFPKYFLAPPAPLRRPKLVAGAPAPDGPAVLRSSPGQHAILTMRHTVAPEYQLAKILHGPITWLASSAIRARAAAPAANVVGRPIARGVSSDDRPRLAGVAIHKSHMSVVASSRQDGSNARSPLRPNDAVASSLGAIQGHRSAGEALVPPRSAARSVPWLHVPGRISTRATTEALLRTPPPSSQAAEIDGSRQFSDMGTSSRTISQELDRSKEQQPHSTLPPSNVYIDGAVLGRWAIQHLERVLARPATGMTGVDPRASLPRGRVSPF
jgi:hypothetical protein